MARGDYMSDFLYRYHMAKTLVVSCHSSGNRSQTEVMGFVVSALLENSHDNQEMFS